MYHLHYQNVSFGKLKKKDIDKIENILGSCIVGIDGKKYEYAPIVKWLAAITLRETLNKRYR